MEKTKSKKKQEQRTAGAYTFRRNQLRNKGREERKEKKKRLKSHFVSDPGLLTNNYNLKKNKNLVY